MDLVTVLKKMLPTVISLAIGAASLFDPAIRSAIGDFAVAHPTLAVLALNLYIGFANFLHGLQVPSVEAAKVSLGKALDKESRPAA